MPSDLKMRLGWNLRRIREGTGMSQERFAREVLDRHRTYAGGLERGERNITLEILEDIAAKLDVDAVELLRELPPAAPMLRAAASGDDPPPDARSSAKRRKPRSG